MGTTPKPTKADLRALLRAAQDTQRAADNARFALRQAASHGDKKLRTLAFSAEIACDGVWSHFEALEQHLDDLQWEAAYPDTPETES